MSVVLRRAALLSLVLASLCIWTMPARASENESFGITAQPETVQGVHRGTFEIPLETSATYQDAVRVFNKTDQPLDLALYAADAIGNGDNYTPGPSDQHPKGVGAWISLSRTKLSLPPHGEATVTFTVTVKTSDPQPNVGAIVVENTATGLAANLSSRADILVRTAPANSPTTSTRVRPLLFRSPWVMVAIGGLVAVLLLVVIGWRRSRRPRDAVVAPGAVEGADHLQEIPVPALPVIRRLGALPDEDDEDSHDDESRPLLDDDLLVEIDEPLFDDEDDFDHEDHDLPPARPVRKASAKAAKPAKRKPAKVSSTAKPKPAARKAVAKRKPPAKRKPTVPATRKARDTNYIPLEDL